MTPSAAGEIPARQLLAVTRNCTRWLGVASLPPSIRDRMQALLAVSTALQRCAEDDAPAPELLARLRAGCAALKSAFSRADIDFDCPCCPLRE